MAILSGNEILKQYERNRIVIEPFERTKLNEKGNSYDVTLGDQIGILRSYETVNSLRIWADLFEQTAGMGHAWAKTLKRQAEALDNSPCPVVLDPAIPLNDPLIVADAYADDPENDGRGWTDKSNGEVSPMFVMVPGVLYLAHTHERCGSDFYIPILHGKSSLARLGLSIHLTAGFGEAGFKAQWTLEMTCVHPIMLYPRMRIGQVEFETVEGAIQQYEGNYKDQVGPVGSKMHRYFKDGKPI